MIEEFQFGQFDGIEAAYERDGCVIVRRVLDAELEPGDVSVHHPLILHGSEPNTSAMWRRGGSIQYMPAPTRIANDEWPSAFLFRGEAVEGVNKDLYLPKPRYVAGEHMAFRGCEAWA